MAQGVVESSIVKEMAKQFKNLLNRILMKLEKSKLQYDALYGKRVGTYQKSRSLRF